MSRVDNLDYGILDLLRQNARAGYGDIGDRVGLSASAVKRRVDRLVADGVIRAFTIQVDPAVDGLGDRGLRRAVLPRHRRPRRAEAHPLGRARGGGRLDRHRLGRRDGAHPLARHPVARGRARAGARSRPRVDHTRSAIVLSHLIHRSYD